MNIHDFKSAKEVIEFFNITTSDIISNSINNSLFELKNNKIVFKSNDDVVGHYSPNNPDGGRLFHRAVVIEKPEHSVTIIFDYREKWYTGLQLTLIIDKECVNFIYDEESWPEWIILNDDFVDWFVKFFDVEED